MSTVQREFDVVIFGATGFTGKKVIAEFLDAAPPEIARRTAIAGRSRSKLEEVAEALETEHKIRVIDGVDVTNAASMKMMAERTRLVLNCVGPYRFHGEPVVRACAESGTDCLDISGEPEFMERMVLQYSDAATASGCYIASGAGFDSIPGDLGTIFTQRLFAAPAVPSSVECFLSILPGPHGYCGHFATWESAVHGIASVGRLRKLRAQARAAGKLPQPQPAGPKLHSKQGIEYDSRVQAYTLPFPGADAAVVRRTQAALTAAGEPAVHFSARITLPSYFAALLTLLFGGLMAALAKFQLGRTLLLRFPRLFSNGLIRREGPSEAQMLSTTTQVTLIGRGFASSAASANSAADRSTSKTTSTSTQPDKQVTVTMRLPDPGYYGTAVLFVHAALALLQERELLPAPGVHTPGFLLRNTGYMERLQQAGVRLDVEWQR